MKKLFILLLSLIIALIFSGCQKNNNNHDDKPSFNTNTDIIGIEGGTITTASGAIIVIPPNALKSSTRITITSYYTQSNLPENIGIMGNFAGGIVLSPDEISFQIPVTITIPLNRILDTVDEVRLFHYDSGDPSNSNYPANYSGWQQTDYIGTVSPDGQSVIAQIDHFSTYVIQMNFGENTLDVLGDMVETLGDNGLSVDFANYQTYFESIVSNLGDLHIYDLPGGFGYDCYKVVGLKYNLYHNLGLLFVNPLYNFKGMEGEIAFFYNYEGDRILQGEQQLIYHLFINVYIDRTPPIIDLTAESTVIQTAEQTDISGSLTCGTEKMKNQDIFFNVNSLGSISPTQQTTDDKGDSTITLTAGNVGGIATVTGEYSANNKDQIEVISDLVNVTIEEEEERYPCCGCYPFVVDFPPMVDPPGDPPPMYFNGCLISINLFRNNPNYSMCYIAYVTCAEFCANRPDDSLCDSWPECEE